MKNLKTISFSININASREIVWNTLWNAETYNKWTKPFMDGSHIVGELKENNTIQFLGKDNCGMSSIIEKLVENEQVVFAHQREIKDGVEVGPLWQNSREIYHLRKEKDSGIELQVVLDITEDMQDYFNKIFPGSLEIVKQISEQKI